MQCVSLHYVHCNADCCITEHCSARGMHYSIRSPRQGRYYQVRASAGSIVDTIQFVIVSILFHTLDSIDWIVSTLAEESRYYPRTDSIHPPGFLALVSVLFLFQCVGCSRRAPSSGADLPRMFSLFATLPSC